MKIVRQLSFVRGFCLTVLLGSLMGCGQPLVPPSVPPLVPHLARLNLAVQTSKPEETRAAWAPLVADMGRKLGVPSQLVVASQAEVVQALADGVVDVAWLSSSAAIDAITQSQGEVFALYVNRSGSRGYNAVLVVRADSPITSVDGALAVGQHRYAGGAKTSPSGHVLPQHFLFTPRGTSAEQVFKSVRVGSHFDNLAALWSREVDVAINNSTDLVVFETLRQPAAQGQLRVLWRSPLVPNDVLVMRRDAPAATRAALRLFFLSTYGQTAAEQALYQQASGIAQFVPASNRLLADVAGFKFATERDALRNDLRLGATTRAEALARVAQRQRLFEASSAGLKD
jgi:phosphonate transport system substrate-binding protein